LGKLNRVVDGADIGGLRDRIGPAVSGSGRDLGGLYPIKFTCSVVYWFATARRTTGDHQAEATVERRQ
jgi:hypothetical protein